MFISLLLILVKAEDRKSQSEHNTGAFYELIVQLDSVQKRAFVRARDIGSSWLSVLPIECHY